MSQVLTCNNPAVGKTLSDKLERIYGRPVQDGQVAGLAGPNNVLFILESSEFWAAIGGSVATFLAEKVRDAVWDKIVEGVVAKAKKYKAHKKIDATAYLNAIDQARQSIEADGGVTYLCSGEMGENNGEYYRPGGFAITPGLKAGDHVTLAKIICEFVALGGEMVNLVEAGRTTQVFYPAANERLEVLTWTIEKVEAPRPFSTGA